MKASMVIRQLFAILTRNYSNHDKIMDHVDKMLYQIIFKGDMDCMVEHHGYCDYDLDDVLSVYRSSRGKMIIISNSSE